MKVDFSPPDITEEEIAEVADTLRSGWITTGPKTKRFEQEIAEYCGTEKTACLNSATAGLELALRLFGIGPGDEVITSAYTYSASASVICHLGATPVLVDTAPGSYQMDMAGLARAVTPRTKAVIPVDIAGIPCDYGQIYELLHNAKHLFTAANEFQAALGRALLLSDAAHSFGASRQGIRSGGLADLTCFSFHAVKNLTTAEGGCVTWRRDIPWDSADVYRRLMLYSLHGQNKSAFDKAGGAAWEYDIIAPYYKCNMTDITASLGLAQLRRYPSMLEQRAALVKTYDAALQDAPVSILSHFGGDFESSRHLYLVRLPGKNEEDRNALIRKMAEAGIAANVHYKPLPLLSAYRDLGFSIGDFPNAYAQYINEVTLPLHTRMTEQDAAYVADSLKDCLQ